MSIWLWFLSYIICVVDECFHPFPHLLAKTDRDYSGSRTSLYVYGLIQPYLPNLPDFNYNNYVAFDSYFDYV